MKKYLHEMLKRKDLLVYLVISGMKSQYRNSYLGYFWWIIDPLLMGLVYYFLRVAILGMRGEYIGAFLIIGLIAWKYLQSALTNSAKSITGKAGIITQVYLPKSIFPIGTTLTELFNFTFGLIAIALFLAAYSLVPGIYILWLPVIMFIQFLFLVSISLVLAYYATFVRDIDSLLNHLMRFWFYASPVIWEADRLPERFSFIVDLNPASTFINGYRNIFMYNSPPDLEKLLVIGLFSLVLMFYMLYFYSKNEHKLIKAL